MAEFANTVDPYEMTNNEPSNLDLVFAFQSLNTCMQHNIL